MTAQRVKTKEQERQRTVKLTAGALLIIVLLSAAVMATIAVVEDNPILVAMLDGAILTVSLVVVAMFAPGLSRDLNKLAEGVYLLRFGIVISWCINGITSFYRLVEGVVGTAEYNAFSVPFRGYMIMMLMIAGVLHVSAIGMIEGKPLWRNIWIVLWSLVVGAGFAGLVVWLDMISDISPTQFVITGTYNPYWVALSIAIAIVGSYIALDIMQRAFGVLGIHKVYRLCGAGIVMGASIWSMHFTGMMAFTLPGFYMTYNFWLTLFSFLLPVAVTTMGFLAASFGIERGILQTLACGLLIALGIVGMHYTGMAAMNIDNVGLTYDYKWVAVSVGVATIASVIALWLAFVETTRVQRAFAAVVLGALGIAGLHYSAMMGAIFFKILA